MSVDVLLSKLDGVKRTGRGRWLSLCPSHDDKRPSLAVRELDDGRLLVHCFAGCDVANVLASVALTFDDLFAPRTDVQGVKGERRPFAAADVLRALSTEITIVVIYTADLRAGRAPSHQDHERFLLACSRISQADCHARR